MKKIISPLILLCLLVGSTFAQQRLTLEEAISIALQRNTSLIKSQNNLSTSEAQLRSAYGDLLPSLGTSASWGWQRVEDDGGTQVDFLGNIIETPASTVESRSYSVNVGGSVTLFDGMANWANISQKSDDLEGAKFDLSKLKQDIVYQTADYFYAVINARELKGVREENVKYNAKFLETIEEKNRLGSVPIADVYAQQVQLGNAELQLIQAENNYENTMTTLLNYLALNVLEDYELVSDVEAGDVNTEAALMEFDNLEVMVNQAMENRFDYKSQQLAVQSAESGVTIAQGGIFPRLSGSYSWGSGATSIEGLFDRTTSSLGLTLSLPIFSNFNTDTNIEFAEIGALNAREDLAALERQIKIEIKLGYLDLVAAKKNLHVTSKNVISAEENRRINSERYNLGAGNIVEVLQADRGYIQPVNDNINALFSFLTARDQLLNALGNLDYKTYE